LNGKGRISPGIPLHEERTEWSWRFQVTWEDEHPLKAQLKILYIKTAKLPDESTLLTFPLPKSPIEVSVHLIPVGDTLPEAEQMIIVVHYGDRVTAVPMQNPFRGCHDWSCGNLGILPQIRLLDVESPSYDRKLVFCIHFSQGS
jgi:hypothetical protein